VTWLDVVLLGLLAVMALAGFQRGLAREILDLAFLGLSTAAALHWFGSLGPRLQAMLGVPSQVAHWLAFVIIFLVTAAVVLTLGWHLDHVQADGVSFSPRLTGALGAALGLVKGLGLAWLLLVILNHLPVLGPKDRVKMREAPVVQAVQGIHPTFMNMIHAFTPTSVSAWLDPELDRRF